MLRAVEQHQLDLAIAAIPVNLEGESQFDFSHPYFIAPLAIAVRAEPTAGVLSTVGAC